MNNAVKAALWSAFVFPGAGQIYLKKYKRGIAIIIPVAACFISMCFSIMKMAVSLIRKMPVEKGKATFAIVLKFVTDAVQELNLYYLALMALLIVVLWIFSTIDAYLLGKKEIQKEHS